ncbi:hypothetical protein [Lysinibacillus sp. fls2-241-R2A-57]|nr:hypothetical protein [Lysinibacillus sp. fls2-241-R2A-57]
MTFLSFALAFLSATLTFLSVTSVFLSAMFSPTFAVKPYFL